MWGGLDGAFVLNEASSEWERAADGIRLGATLAVCGGELMSVGGMEDGSISKEVVVWRGGRWTSMSNMLVECIYPCVVSTRAQELDRSGLGSNSHSSSWSRRGHHHHCHRQAASRSFWFPPSLHAQPLQQSALSGRSSQVNTLILIAFWVQGLRRPSNHRGSTQGGGGRRASGTWWTFHLGWKPGKSSWQSRSSLLPRRCCSW